MVDFELHDACNGADGGKRQGCQAADDNRPDAVLGDQLLGMRTRLSQHPSLEQGDETYQTAEQVGTEGPCHRGSSHHHNR